MNTQEKVANYIRLREHKKLADSQYKESMTRVNAAMKKLEAELMQDIADSGGTSLAGDHGTVYIKTMSSASVKDRDAFFRFVFDTKNLELLDARANKAVVRELHAKGTVVPGVNYTEVQTVGVRKGK